MTTSAISQSSTSSTPNFSGITSQEAVAYLRRAIERMKSLQAVERVIATLERSVLNRVPEKFHLTPLVTAINALNLAIREGNEAGLSTRSSTVQAELETAFQQVAIRDAAIMPYDLRRYCEGDGSLLDLNTLAALTSFYRALPHSTNNRGKYDFVVTRLFTNAEPGRPARHRQLKLSREQLVKRLTEMCRAWGESVQPNLSEGHQIAESIALFDQFMAEIKQINQIDTLVNGAFFQRFRAFKAEVGALLYLPEVSAVSIEANVVITNHFLHLLENESQEIVMASAPLQSLTEAYSDMYSNETGEISRLLQELQSDTQTDEVVQKQVSRLTRLLRLASPLQLEQDFPLPPGTPLAGENEETKGIPETTPAIAIAAEAAIKEELEALAAVPENQPLIVAYLKSSAEARRLDLHSFLSPLPDGGHPDLKNEGKARRAALALIFRADEIVHLELGENSAPGEALATRVNQLFDQLGCSSDDMRDLIKIALKHEQTANYEVLLHVYNQLMATRLRLQSALLRHTASTAPATDAVPEPQHKSEQTAEAPPTPDDKTKRAGVLSLSRLWLVATVLVLLIAAIGVRSTFSKKETVKDDADVVRLARDQMPHGALFTEAKLHQDLVTCIVTEQWLQLPAEERTQKMQDLLKYGQKQGAQRVLLITAKGSTVGFVATDEVYAP
ncbi:MAG TPA: hypothetical protein VFZ34_00350 [Blastocatellia bacterium]|nr:hypothetical protein [Blastocatellia bacterium]